MNKAKITLIVIFSFLIGMLLSNYFLTSFNTWSEAYDYGFNMGYGAALNDMQEQVERRFLLEYYKKAVSVGIDSADVEMANEILEKLKE